MDDKRFAQAVNYGKMIINDVPDFCDFAIAMVDYMGEDVCPECKNIYSLSVKSIPDAVLKVLKITQSDVVSEYNSQDILNSYRLFKSKQKEDEVKRKIKENVDELQYLIEKYRTSTEFKIMMDFIARHNYMAPYNAMLVQAQKPGAEFAFNANTWRKKYRRRPKPNAQRIVTLVPFGPTQYVFDYSDTEPIPGELFFSTKENLMQEWDRSLTKTKGNVSKSEFNRLLCNLPKYGIYLDRTFNAANTFSGYIMRYDGGNVEINFNQDYSINHSSEFILSVNKNEDDNSAFATICHELGHLFCRHIYYDISKKRQLTIKEKEFEAETVAWLVCKRHGVKNPSEEYLATYAPKGKIPFISLDAVMRAVTEIEKMLDSNMNLKSTLWYKEDKKYKKVIDETMEFLKTRRNLSR